MYFMDKKEKMLLELSFPEVMSLITNRWVSQGKMPQISFLTTLIGPWGLRERQGEREAHVPGCPARAQG